MKIGKLKEILKDIPDDYSLELSKLFVVEGKDFDKGDKKEDG